MGRHKRPGTHRLGMAERGEQALLGRQIRKKTEKHIQARTQVEEKIVSKIPIY